MTISTAQKSAEAFRTISEVAEALKLPQHVLRFWETRFTQIKPLKRAGGRRFYRPEDVELLGAIRQLLYGDGYTIRGVQRILREQGPRAVSALARNRAGPPHRAGSDDERAETVGTIEDEKPPFDPATLFDKAPIVSATPFVPEAFAVRPAPDQPSPLSVSANDRGESFARLRAVLDELDACRGLLIAARGPASAS